MFVMLGLGCVSSTARADASFALSWRSEPGTAACVTETALRDAVEKKLQRNPFTDRDRADIAIEGEERSSGGRFRARVKQTDRNGVVLGSRELDLESCARLFRATTIVVALFIDRGSDREPGEEPALDTAPTDDGVRLDDEEPTPSAPSSPPIRIPPAASPSPPTQPPPAATPSLSVPPLPPADARAPGFARPPFDLSLGAGGGAAVGFLPSASAMVRGVARLERAGSRWSFEWSGGYSLQQAFRTRSVRGSFAGVDQQVRACLALNPLSRIRVDACGGAFWGAIVPETGGVREQNDAWRPLAGPLAAVAAQLRDGTRAARLDLGVTVPLVSRNLYFESSAGELERVYSSGRVIMFVGLSGLLTIL
ncbi:MAG: hypothetical protein BGO98_33165 [Myxococcales bacterium 68-20]|nr:MAG: hypothetical protein BGO98_33165 [Myxococcales bacterium 68-20]